jgi:prolyl 4-hydroxylase
LQQITTAYTDDPREQSDGRHNEALAALRAAAREGDPKAKAALAERLLTQPPYNLEEGTAWAVSGAQDGDPNAAHLAVLLSAWGLGLGQNWDRTLDFLQIAAASGHDTDKRVLAGLAGEWHVAFDPGTGEPLPAARCANLRTNIHIAELLKLPPTRIVSNAPRIAVINGFLVPEMCDWLIARARPNLARAKVYDPSTGSEASSIRTNTEFQIGTFGSDLIVMLLQHRIAALTGLSLLGMEACTILHYAPGEEFKRHHDCFDTSSPENARIVATGGQRVLTFLIYLNDDYTGGETEFPHLRQRFRGRKGDALMFWNIAVNFSPDLRTLHAGLPPITGEKWLFSQWIRGRRP